MSKEYVVEHSIDVGGISKALMGAVCDIFNSAVIITSPKDFRSVIMPEEDRALNKHRWKRVKGKSVNMMFNGATISVVLRKTGKVMEIKDFKSREGSGFYAHAEISIDKGEAIFIDANNPTFEIADGGGVVQVHFYEENSQALDAFKSEC